MSIHAETVSILGGRRVLPCLLAQTLFLKSDFAQSLAVVNEDGKEALIVLQAERPAAFPAEFEVHPHQLAQHRPIEWMLRVW
jgi:hypothetical protein